MAGVVATPSALSTTGAAPTLLAARTSDPLLLGRRRAARVDYGALNTTGFNSAAELAEAAESRRIADAASRTASNRARQSGAATEARLAADVSSHAARRASESVAERAARLAPISRSNARRGMAATAVASTNVTADQLRDAEHDPIAAMLLVAESAGSNKWTPRLRALRRATTDEERLIAAQALGVALREEALSPEAAAATVRTFHRQNDGAVSLPACASCGMRAIPSDADDYQRLDLAQLECLRFTRVQEEALLPPPSPLLAAAAACTPTWSSRGPTCLGRSSALPQAWLCHRTLSSLCVPL